MAATSTLFAGDAVGHAFQLPVAASASRAPRLPAPPSRSEARASADGPLQSALPSATWGCLAAAAVAGFTAAKVERRRGRAGLRRAAPGHGAHEAAPPALSRADLLRGLSGSALAGPLGLLPAVAPAPAVAKGLNEASQVLTSYGLPELSPKEGPPLGWSIVVEPIGLAPDAYYGRFKLGSEPQVVMFDTPPLWVVSKPNIDFNGAAGTVQANDYGKGDSATLFVDTGFKGQLGEMTKKEYKTELLKALTQKGKGFIEALRVEKVRDGAPGYKIVEYTYDIESGAGFTIARSGSAAVSQVGSNNQLQVFWTGVVTPRWKKMETDLKRMVESFRIGNVPKSISTAMVKEFKNMDEAISASDLPKAL